MQTAKELNDLIGNTPMLELSRLFPNSPARVLAKLEMFNPMSIKDRPVLSMIRDATDAGRIGPDTEVVEASSGNTAIAIAALGAVMGFGVRVFMSEATGAERRKILCAYGATVVLTPAVEHTRGARERAMAWCEARPNTTLFLNQHGNPANARAHETTTGPEIWEQTGGKVDAVVIGLGTGGTFEGTSAFIKARNPDVRIVGFEPASSPVYSGGAQGKHRITGIGPGFVTDNVKRGRDRLDEIVLVPDDEALAMTRRIARTEGLLVGVTSGAAAWTAGQVAARPEFAGKTIVCFFYDTGERYLSIPDLFPEDNVERMD